MQEERRGARFGKAYRSHEGDTNVNVLHYAPWGVIPGGHGKASLELHAHGLCLPGSACPRYTL